MAKKQELNIKNLANQLGDLIDKKNKAYGNSFAKSSEILAVLYPNGVLPEKYPDLLFTIRILDKLARIATDPEAFSEDPYNDISGYGFLGSIEAKKKKLKQNKIKR